MPADCHLRHFPLLASLVVIVGGLAAPAPAVAAAALAELPYAAELQTGKPAATEPRLIIEASPKLDLLMAAASLADHFRTVNQPMPDNPLGNFWGTNMRQYGAEAAPVHLAKLRVQGFWGDRLLDYALRLSEPPELSLLAPWSEALLGSVGSAGDDPGGELELFRQELSEFAQASRFMERWEGKKGEYESLVSAMRQQLGSRNPVVVNASFWGAIAEGDFYLLPSPLINGGYMTSLEAGGRRHQFLAFGPARPTSVSGARFLHHLVHHELSHPLLDPVIEANAEILETSSDLWRVVAPFLDKEPQILNWLDCIGEHLLRGYNIRLLGEADPVLGELYVGSESGAGFLYLRQFLEMLAEYDADRVRWPTFNDYVPVMAKHLEQHIARIQELIPDTRTPDLDVANPGFENKQPGWLVDGWSLVASGQVLGIDERRTAKVSIDSVAHEGNASLRLDVHDGTSDLVAVEQGPLAVRSGGKIKVSGWIKGRDIERRGLQQKVCGFYVLFQSVDGNIISRGETDSAVGTLDWTELTGEFVAPAGTSRFTLGILLGMSGTAWIDDVKVERID